MIFVDTSFWIAAALPRDQRHADAVRLLERFSSESLATSNLVLGESWTFLNRRAGHAAAVDFLDRAESSPRVSVHAVSPQIEERSWRWLRRHDERSYSFVDATSFLLMETVGIRRALAFDGDFTAAGFTELRAR